MSTLYPVFLKLDGLRVVVIGAGPVAAGKLDQLLAAGAQVTVIAPQISDQIRTRAALLCAPSANSSSSESPAIAGASSPSMSLVERAFTPSDLDGARWVVAAAPPAINAEVAKAAAARGLFVNAVDDTASATAYLGGVVHRGDVTVAISTRGLAPALAGLLREAVEAVLPLDLDKWVEVAKQARADWKRAGVPMAQRRPLLLRALDRLYAGAPS